MKKTISLFLIITMLSALCAICVNATSVPTIKVGTACAAQGETVEINVDFLNNPGINTYSLSIDYDETRLELINAESNPEVSGQFIYARRAVWATSGDNSFSGTFLTLTFKVHDDAEEGEANVTVSYNPGDICNYDEEDVLFTVESGFVSVGTTKTPTISISSTEANTGDTVSVNVDFLNNPGINTYSLSIDYDETRLELINAESNPEVSGQFIYARRAVWATSGDNSFSGTFLTLTFKVHDDAEEGEANVTVSYNPGDICNYDEEEVEFIIVQGVISVSSSAYVLPGDVDGDGDVTVKDSKLMKKNILGTVGDDCIVFVNADIDGDGEISLKDMKSIKKILLGTF